MLFIYVNVNVEADGRHSYLWRIYVNWKLHLIPTIISSVKWLAIGWTAGVRFSIPALRATQPGIQWIGASTSTELHLIPSLRMRGALPVHPPPSPRYLFMWWWLNTRVTFLQEYALPWSTCTSCEKPPLDTPAASFSSHCKGFWTRPK